jgi:hypothetical protein
VAKSVAEMAKKSGIIIYTIGLGKDINQPFLQQISSSANHYFNAPATSTLMAIYENISSTICKEMPARIEITYKIFGSKVQ